ncbi:MAG: hypothetical protein AVDCRST_MAG76-2668, partial [uncultured Acidimicrobiales bacterium]
GRQAAPLEGPRHGERAGGGHGDQVAAAGLLAQAEGRGSADQPGGARHVVGRGPGLGRVLRGGGGGHPPDRPAGGGRGVEGHRRHLPPWPGGRQPV